MPRRVFFVLPILLFIQFSLAIVLSLQSLAQVQKPRGEIRVVESWRPDINVLGHNVLQYLWEYALDKNELAA